MTGAAGGWLTGAGYSSLAARRRNELRWNTSGARSGKTRMLRTRRTAMSWSPAATSFSRVQSSQSDASATKTAPDSEARQLTCSNRLAPFLDRARQVATWLSASTLMPSPGSSRSTGHVVEAVAIQTETRAGSRETDVNELAVTPTGWPSAMAHTAVTPLGKQPYACRSRAGSCAAAGGEVAHDSRVMTDPPSLEDRLAGAPPAGTLAGSPGGGADPRPGPPRPAAGRSPGSRSGPASRSARRSPGPG